MCVLNVQYSPSGIFSVKICARNPHNRTAKVIRRSIAIAVSQSVSQSTDYMNVNVTNDWRPASKSRQPKMCGCLPFVWPAFAIIRGSLVVIALCAVVCWRFVCMRSRCLVPSSPLSALSFSLYLLLFLAQPAACQNARRFHFLLLLLSPINVLKKNVRIVCAFTAMFILFYFSCKFSQFLICNSIFSSFLFSYFFFVRISDSVSCWPTVASSAVDCLILARNHLVQLATCFVSMSLKMKFQRRRHRHR